MPNFHKVCTTFRESVLSILLHRKEHENLTKASKGVVNLCTAAENYFLYFKHSVNIFNNNLNYLPKF